MNKKFFILPLAMAISFTGSLTANALHKEGSLESLKNQLQGEYIYVEDWNMFDNYDTFSDVYVSKDSSHFVCAKKVGKDVAVLDLTDDYIKVNAAIKEKFGDDYGLGHYSYSKDRYDINIPNQEKAKEVCAFLKEQNMIDSFIYVTDKCYINDFYTPYILSYYSKEKEKLEKYIAENNIDYTIEDDTYEEGNVVKLIPNKEKSIRELVETAKNIYNDMGLKIYLNDTPALARPMLSSEIDVYNYVSGDANCDGETTVADATTILQYLGNADKYPLDAQGKFNGDMNNDGITATDALEIQILDAAK